MIFAFAVMLLVLIVTVAIIGDAEALQWQARRGVAVRGGGGRIGWVKGTHFTETKGLMVRGGDDSDDDESEEDDESEYDEDDESEYDEEEEEEEPTPSKKKSASKSHVSSLLSPSLSLSSYSFLKTFLSLISPPTLIKMTSFYWKSLLNPSFPTPADLGQDSGSTLRSALTRKSLSQAGGGKKGTKKMKRGQAKTLNDLPKLNQ